jgi:tripartite-type tricarboxylate transporter receptor subunit TctC
MNRRKLLALAAGLPALSIGAQQAKAQTYPSSPIRIIVAYPPGGGNDVAARVLGARLQERLGQPVMVDNRPGAAGQVGTAVAANSPPDGYTLLLTNPGPQAVSPALQPNLPYDVVKSFSPVAIVARMPFFVVVPGASPHKTLAELIAAEKANPGKYNFGSAGIGSLSQIVGEMFNRAAGTNFMHVPYKGAAPQIADTVNGRVEMSILSAVDSAPQLKQGGLRALVTTGRERSPVAPNAPTMEEAGFPGFEVDIWYAVLAPAGTPPDIVKKLNAELSSILKEPDVQAKFRNLAASPGASTPEELAEVIKRDRDKYAEVVKAAGIKAE